MTRATQGILLTLTGAVLLRIALVDDVYLNYVNAWMRWPLVACGLFLLALALTYLVLLEPADDGHEEEEPADGHVPRAAWLLFLPSVLIFVVAPPALGAHLAEKTGSTTAAPTESQLESSLAPLPSSDPAPVTVTEFFVRARYDAGLTLSERRVEMTGFVSYDAKGNWFVTRFGINCCAADASATRILVEGPEGTDAPARDQWVRLVGTWVEGSGLPGSRVPPAVMVSELELIDPPKIQYE